MRNKVAIGLSVLTLIIGATCLFYGWGSASSTAIRTCVAVLLINKFLGDWYNPISKRMGMAGDAQPNSQLTENVGNLAIWSAMIVFGISLIFLVTGAFLTPERRIGSENRDIGDMNEMDRNERHPPTPQISPRCQTSH